MRSSQVACVVLVLLALGDTAESKGNRYARVDRKWKMQKKACTDVDCSHLAPAVNMNCVNECTSPDCYALVYASEPLEDGEVDEYRAHRFTSCLRKEFLKRKPTAKTSRDEL